MIRIDCIAPVLAVGAVVLALAAHPVLQPLPMIKLAQT
jgi:hypothetical protein